MTTDPLPPMKMIRCFEPQWEIIGEAVSQLAKIDKRIVSKISKYQRIISFRNVLIHGYADLDNRIVWDIVETDLPVLVREVDLLLEDR